MSKKLQNELLLSIHTAKQTHVVLLSVRLLNIILNGKKVSHIPHIFYSTSMALILKKIVKFLTLFR